MRRKKTRKSLDRRIFRNTAKQTKEINVNKPSLMRGGYRL